VNAQEEWAREQPAAAVAPIMLYSNGQGTSQAEWDRPIAAEMPSAAAAEAAGEDDPAAGVDAPEAPEIATAAGSGEWVIIIGVGWGWQ
jgi:hypothetical protein